ncbi:MAG: acyl--CoA ligase [Arcanobacterium sp.]|nr:acyl--CoA ligase [Arcanobacterium sp.]
MGKWLFAVPVQGVAMRGEEQPPYTVGMNNNHVGVNGHDAAAPYFNPAHSLDRAAAAHPQRVSIWYGERVWSVEQAAQATRSIARLLESLGVQRGDRVMMVARNSPQHLLFYVACARIGAVFAPISYRFTERELNRIFAQLTPSVIVADPETAAGALSALPVQGTSQPFTGATKEVACFVIDDDVQAQLAPELVVDPGLLEQALATGWRGLTASVEMADRQGDDGKEAAHGLRSRAAEALNSVWYPEGVGAIILTSGSAGEPKLVPLTYENLWWGSRNFREGFEYSNADVELVVAPLTHIGGFNGTTVDLFSHGGTVVVVREFRPATVLRELERRRVAMMFGVPTMYAALLRDPHFAGADLSAFRLPLTGGSVAPMQLLRELDAAGLHMVNVWGMTETSASGCYLPAEHLASRAGSIGRPFAHVQARIVDLETGADAAGPEPRGELWLRGPSVVAGYWESAETANGSLNADGGTNDAAQAGAAAWLHTGDLVRMDPDGYLWVIGRVHELINTGGEKVAPSEVMHVLAGYPGVSDVAVVGVPDPVWGEAVAVALIMDQGAVVPSLAQVRAFAAHSLADFKLPRAIRGVDHFPLNSNGKLDRAALVRLLCE